MGALASSLKIQYETFTSAEEFLERYESSLSGCALLDYRLGGVPVLGAKRTSVVSVPNVITSPGDAASLH